MKRAFVLWRASWVLATGVFIAQLAYDARAGIDGRAHDSYGRDVRSALTRDARLNEQVMQTRQSLVMHYDALSRTTAELRVAYSRLVVPPPFLDAKSADQVKAAAVSAQTAFIEKTRTIEDFKSQNAIFRNSARFFPVAAQALRDRLADAGSPKEDSMVNELLLAVNAYVQVPGEAEKKRAHQARAMLAGASVASELESDRALVLLHADALERHAESAAVLTQAVLTAPTMATAERLDVAYEQGVSAARDAANRRRAFMVLTLAGIASLLAADIILRLRRTARTERETAKKLAAANDALLRERERETELSELKGRFVTMTSHEFRTPLSVILSSTELLEAYGERWPPAKRSDHYGRVKTAVGTMRELLDAVLVIDRSDAGRLECSPGPLDIGRFLREAVDAISSTSMRHEFRLTMPESFPDAAIDEKLAVHIVTNLLSNAVKYSPAGGPVDVSARAAGGDLVLVVRDRGIGIGQVDQSRLFESFHRGTNVGTIPGTGLGLAVVKRAVTAHGGDISVVSAEGEGSTFTVKLPVFTAAPLQRREFDSLADAVSNAE